MKARLIILFLFVGYFGFLSPDLVQASYTKAQLPSSRTEALSDSYLKKEKQSIATSRDVSSMVASERRLSSRIGTYAFTDPTFPGEGEGEEGNGGVVGGPVGDVTFPITASLLLFYLLFRAASASRRKSNL